VQISDYSRRSFELRSEERRVACPKRAARCRSSRVQRLQCRDGLLVMSERTWAESRGVFNGQKVEEVGSGIDSLGNNKFFARAYNSPSKVVKLFF